MTQRTLMPKKVAREELNALVDKAEKISSVVPERGEKAVLGVGSK